MKLGIIARINCYSCIKIARRIIELIPPSWEIVLEDKLAKSLNRKGTNFKDIDADIIIVIGGDGTILKTAQLSRGKIMGINVGGLGFLSEVEIGNIEESVYNLIQGNYKTYDVMKLNVYVNGKLFGQGINDVVIHTARISKIRKFSVYINDRFMENTSADGVIIATPIGSTSYSYSAGGPILIPSLKAMVISYIAPFGSRLRPIVCPDNTKITIKIIGKFSSLVIIDGQKESVVTGNDQIDIRISDEKLTFIELKNSFYDRLREKLIKDVVN
ncbi:NAD(+) kinase [Ferroplasma sp.]|uniref:NAD(+) kinase n=1 Tax=Ferroplasma sp. TaxID=2591003 RepID=UPI00307DF057